jgi:ribosomal protein S28E/S33
VTVLPVADTYIDAANPTINHGTSTTLRLDSSPDVHGYLRFTITGVSGTITQVRLLLFANNSDSSGIRLWSVIDNTWGELTMNYSNAPALGAQIASLGSFAAGWVTLDVTSYITGNGTFSIGITNLSSTAISVDSRESGANAPQLIFTYSGSLGPTSTPTSAATSTSTSTPTITSVATPTSTSTPTATPVFTPTASATATVTPTATATPTSVSVNTPTSTFTPVATPTSTSTPTVSSVTFVPAADTYVDAANPTINHGTSATLRLDSSPDVHAYLRFTISGFSGTITQVRLLLFANNSDSSGIRAWSILDNTWGELTMTYSNAPALGAQITSLGSFASGWVTLNVTSYIIGNGTYSIGITNLSSTTISVDSRESGANAPQLIINFH